MVRMSDTTVDINLGRVSPIRRVTFNPNKSRQPEQYAAKKPSNKPFSEVLASEISGLSQKASRVSTPSGSLNNLKSC